MILDIIIIFLISFVITLIVINIVLFIYKQFNNSEKFSLQNEPCSSTLEEVDKLILNQDLPGVLNPNMFESKMD